MSEGLDAGESAGRARSTRGFEVTESLEVWQRLAENVAAMYSYEIVHFLRTCRTSVRTHSE